jgi:hypothetical protein
MNREKEAALAVTKRVWVEPVLIRSEVVRETAKDVPYASDFHGVGGGITSAAYGS